MTRRRLATVFLEGRFGPRDVIPVELQDGRILWSAWCTDSISLAKATAATNRLTSGLVPRRPGRPCTLRLSSPSWLIRHRTRTHPDESSLSVLYYNHVVYLTITVALMGFGISGVLVSLSRVHEGNATRTLERLLLAYAISLVCCRYGQLHASLVSEPGADREAHRFLPVARRPVPFRRRNPRHNLHDERVAYSLALRCRPYLTAFVVVAFGFSIQYLGAAGILIVCGVAAFIAYALQCARRGASAGVRAVLVASGFVMLSIFAAPQLVSSQPELDKTAGRFRLPEYAGARLERGEWTSIAKIDVWADSGRDVLTGEISPNASRKKMITQDADAHTILWDSERLDELSGWAKRRMPYPSGAASIAYLIRPLMDVLSDWRRGRKRHRYSSGLRCAKDYRCRT